MDFFVLESVMIIMPIIICALGLFLIIRLGPFFILHPRRILRALKPSLASRESRESFFLALAGTLGVGNIFGVSLGIIVGGVGSIFWLVVSSVFSMIIKYSEVVLGFSVSNIRYGMPSVIAEGGGRIRRACASLYALLGIALSLFMGALMQTRSITDTALGGGINEKIVTLAVLLFTLYFVVFGSEKIKKATYYIIPLTTIIYILLVFFVIIRNYQSVIPGLKSIVSAALSFKSAAGGTLGALVGCGFREGFLRGVMSNEAGAGTSLVGHSADASRTAGVAGLFGIFEVVFDTLVLCPLTGIAIVISGVPICGTPMALVTAAFSSSLGGWVNILLVFLVFSFAYSTIMSLYYYGVSYTEYLSLPRPIFSLLFLAFIFISPAFSEGFVTVIDVILLLMTLPTAYCIIKNVGMIKHHTDEMLNLK